MNRQKRISNKHQSHIADEEMEDIEIFPPYIAINSGVILFVAALSIVFVLVKLWRTLRHLPSDVELDMYEV